MGSECLKSTLYPVPMNTYRLSHWSQVVWTNRRLFHMIRLTKSFILDYNCCNLQTIMNLSQPLFYSTAYLTGLLWMLCGLGFLGRNMGYTWNRCINGLRAQHLLIMKHIAECQRLGACCLEQSISLGKCGKDGFNCPIHMEKKLYMLKCSASAQPFKILKPCFCLVVFAFGVFPPCNRLPYQFSCDESRPLVECVFIIPITREGKSLNKGRFASLAHPPAPMIRASGVISGILLSGCQENRRHWILSCHIHLWAVL